MKNNHINHLPTKIAVSAGIALWFLFALIMGISGQYAQGTQKPPLYLGLTLAVPITLFVTAYLRRGSLWAFAQTLNLKVIVLLHVGRVMGLLFLVNYIQGRLPGGFALPAGIGDVLTALTAVPLVMAMSRHTPELRKRFMLWNIFGLTDLIIAVGSGILHSPSSFGIFARTGTNTLLLSQFPLCLIPTFLVPFYILLHLLALSRAKEIEDDTLSKYA